ncbi:MAG: DUF7309 domain-containing protein [Thermodesulfobacteriota bacterium]
MTRRLAGLGNNRFRLLKNMGRSYRGCRWPQFRSYRPGYMEELPGQGERFQMNLALQGATVMFQWLRQGKAPQAGPGRFPLQRVLDNLNLPTPKKRERI